MIRFRSRHLWRKFLLLILSLSPVLRSFGLNTDGILLFSFKYSISKDPLNVLRNWNFSDENPCSWNGITCFDSRVTALSLPNSQLQGTIPANFGLIQNLQILDLSNNSFNGSLPVSIFNSTQLRILDLSNNFFAGGLPETIARLQSLQSLNLSDNELAGMLPSGISSLPNLAVVSLKNNYFIGPIPTGFRAVRVLDLSANLINGSLPRGFVGDSLRYFNVSFNRLSGGIPAEFAAGIPGNATVDLSFNNLTGKVPDSAIFSTDSFAGNPDLCGGVTRNPCPINASAATSPPAIAAIPRTFASGPSSAASSGGGAGMKPGTIAGIIIGDIAGVAILGTIFFYIYRRLRNRKPAKTTAHKQQNDTKDETLSSSSSESKGFSRWSCLQKRRDKESESESESESDSSSSENDGAEQDNAGTLVTVGGERELELETLLKASAYILGASGSSIMYKAVLEDGSALAVRRIGENHVERFRDFETQVRAIAKLVHPNLVRVRGFYWGLDEKLVIYEFVPNGSLANARYRKVGSSPCSHMPWEARLKIAKGVARGLCFLHDKKHVHGNLKPSNILLGPDMEPKIGDFGLERLVIGDTSSKAGGSARIFGSKRSTASRDSFQDNSHGPSPSPSPSPSSIGGLSPYHAPESLRSLKPNPKWDVYSFGMILLELLTGKIIVVDESGEGNNGLVVDDKNRALRMADVAIRGEVEGKEEDLLACFKVGYSCGSPIPQKRPTMKEVVQILEKIPSSTNSLPYCYGQ